jgi:hypothetical protein
LDPLVLVRFLAFIAGFALRINFLKTHETDLHRVKRGAYLQRIDRHMAQSLFLLASEGDCRRNSSFVEVYQLETWLNLELKKDEER